MRQRVDGNFSDLASQIFAVPIEELSMNDSGWSSSEKDPQNQEEEILGDKEW